MKNEGFKAPNIWFMTLKMKETWVPMTYNIHLCADCTDTELENWIQLPILEEVGSPFLHLIDPSETPGHAGHAYQ